MLCTPGCSEVMASGCVLELGLAVSAVGEGRQALTGHGKGNSGKGNPGVISSGVSVLPWMP